MKKLLTALLFAAVALSASAKETIQIIYGFSAADNSANYSRNLAEEANKIQDKYNFVFQLPIDTIVVIDEAHRCKNHKSINSTMLQAFRNSNTKILLLSATITEKIDCFKPFGIVLNF